MLIHRYAGSALGGSDCEEWQPGLLHQPVNSLSSLAYVAAGLWIATRWGTDRADRVTAVVFGAAVLSIGVGSLLYHGPQWPGSAVVHDATIPSAVLFITVNDLALLRGWGLHRQMTTYAMAVAAACLLAVVLPASSGTVVALSAVSAVAAEAMLVRRRRDHSARAALLLAGTLLAAALAGLAGRTGSPLCRPHSLLQGHALWHVLTAAALLQWHRLRAEGKAGRSRPLRPTR
ncbi:hypothetical protein [Actinomadura sp. HBU206391]|uniref:hypothetical protein n=1 Tax=Actinomadura sp. HBU206391 TaxID=2731692 RepID=UPI001C9BE024|nr:hypothetical protein [Actinomadura sp. HBU206391]